MRWPPGMCQLGFAMNLFFPKSRLQVPPIHALRVASAKSFIPDTLVIAPITHADINSSLTKRYAVLINSARPR